MKLIFLFIIIAGAVVGGYYYIQSGEEIRERPVEVQDQTGGDQTDSDSQNVVRISVEANRFSFDPDPITVKQDDKVILTVTSTDVTHGIAIPEFGVNKVVNPGDTATVEFIASKSGSFQIFCSVACGSGHRDMKATLVVEPR